MILSSESPLRRIPSNLDARQACYLDGIRFAVEMCDVSYNRLIHRLWEVAVTFNAGEALPAYEGAYILQDAWSIIDSVHRLRSLLAGMPRLDKGMPTYQLFIRETECATALRNTVQHLREELRDFADRGWPVWGVLTWLALMKEDGTEVQSCLINAGRTQTGTHPILNPMGRTFVDRVDHVTLQSKEQSVPLSKLYRMTERITRPLEKSLASQFPHSSTDGSGMLVSITFAIPPQEELTPNPSAGDLPSDPAGV